MGTTTLDNSIIFIKPSQRLFKYIKGLHTSDDMPLGIANMRSKNKLDTSIRKPIEHKLLTCDEDIQFLNKLPKFEDPPMYKVKASDVKEEDRLLNLEDLHWLHDRIVSGNEGSGEKVYFHELFQESEVVVPKNREIQRNPVLELRCQKLKAQQQNRQYNAMTKNVDCVRHNHPEDTIAYQMKQINSHLIAIAQFIVSVLAGFAFGFLGMELMVGKLDFGFRLLLGIICALIIALAELYFLAKKLNEDLEYETSPKTVAGKVKVE